MSLERPKSEEPSQERIESQEGGSIKFYYGPSKEEGQLNRITTENICVDHKVHITVGSAQSDDWLEKATVCDQTCSNWEESEDSGILFTPTERSNYWDRIVEIAPELKEKVEEYGK